MGHATRYRRRHEVDSYSAFFENEELFPPGAAVPDSAWRLVSKRLQPIHERSAYRLKTMLENGDSSPAMPAL